MIFSNFLPFSRGHNQRTHLSASFLFFGNDNSMFRCLPGNGTNPTSFSFSFSGNGNSAKGTRRLRHTEWHNSRPRIQKLLPRRRKTMRANLPFQACEIRSTNASPHEKWWPIKWTIFRKTMSGEHRLEMGQNIDAKKKRTSSQTN